MAISRHSAGRCAAWFQTLNLDLEPVSRYPPRCVDANTSVAAEYSIAFRTTRNASEVRAVRAILLCGAPLQPCPLRTRLTNPTPHKWERNIRTEMLLITFLALSLFDSNDHSFAVDIADLQADSLGDAQPGSVTDPQ